MRLQTRKPISTYCRLGWSINLSTFSTMTAAVQEHAENKETKNINFSSRPVEGWWRILENANNPISIWISNPIPNPDSSMIFKVSRWSWNALSRSGSVIVSLIWMWILWRNDSRGHTHRFTQHFKIRNRWIKWQWSPIRKTTVNGYGCDTMDTDVGWRCGAN